MAHSIRLLITRGGVTGNVVADVEGLGDTVLDAVRDALTARGVGNVRLGDFINIQVPEWQKPYLSKRAGGQGGG